jgi:hypothetical protein
VDARCPSPVPQQRQRSTRLPQHTQSRACFSNGRRPVAVRLSIAKGASGELRARGIEAWFSRMADELRPYMAAHLLAKHKTVTRAFLLDVICDRLTR